jgi:predicted dehydrogenase
MNRIPIAVIGLNWGSKVIRDQLLRGPGAEHFQLAGVCAREPDRVDACAREFGVRGFHDIEEVFRDRAIPAIGLMTGPFGRADLMRRAVEAGKHIITTKPVEVDPDAALDVLRLARQRGRVIHLNSPGPLAPPDLNQILAWREEFQLGRPVAARADIWSNYRETSDGSWYDDADRCPVAPIFRLGIYLINDLIRLVGRPVAVSVMSSRLFTGRPTPDNAQLSLRFENGTLATIFSSFCVNDAQWWLSSLTLNFENGTVYRNVGPTRGPSPRQHPELALVVNQNGKPCTTRITAAGSTEDYQWHAFHSAIRGDPLPVQLEDEDVVLALRVVRAMRRAEISRSTEPVLG